MNFMLFVLSPLGSLPLSLSSSHRVLHFQASRGPWSKGIDLMPKGDRQVMNGAGWKRWRLWQCGGTGTTIWGALPLGEFSPSSAKQPLLLGFGSYLPTSRELSKGKPWCLPLQPVSQGYGHGLGTGQASYKTSEALGTW